MLVVVAIIAVVSGVLMFNYSNFSTNVSVRNLAQEVALAVRKAQTYATSVRTIDGVGMTSATFPGYGVSFATSTNAADLTPPNAWTAGPRQFVLFADTSSGTGNSTYESGTSCGTPGPGNECIESFAITSFDKIASICNGSASGGSCYTNAKVDVTFRRPTPDALICLTTPSLPVNCNVSYVTINLISAKGLTRSIQVWNTGQISVQ